METKSATTSISGSTPGTISTSPSRPTQCDLKTMATKICEGNKFAEHPPVTCAAFCGKLKNLSRDYRTDHLKRIAEGLKERKRKRPAAAGRQRRAGSGAPRGPAAAGRQRRAGKPRRSDRWLGRETRHGRRLSARAAALLWLGKSGRPPDSAPIHAARHLRRQPWAGCNRWSAQYSLSADCAGRRDRQACWRRPESCWSCQGAAGTGGIAAGAAQDSRRYWARRRRGAGPRRPVARAAGR